MCNCGGNDNVLKLSFACKTLLHVESRILFKKVKCNLCLTILSSGYWTEKDKIHYYEVSKSNILSQSRMERSNRREGVFNSSNKSSL